MSYAQLQNFKLFYESHGAGEPLVLIAGFASGAWNWFKQVDALSKDFQVITFDPRGVSRSEIETDIPVSIQTIADDVNELLDHLKIEKANILGASFGGFVAQEFALEYPERVRKLILACTSFGGKNHVAPSMEVLAAFASTDGLNTLDGVKKYIIPAFTPEFVKARPDEVETVCNLREQNVVPENVYFQQLQSATTFDTESRISNIEAETLILTGDGDAVVPMRNSENLAKLIPHSTLKIFKNGSHMFFIEKSEEFNTTVKDFILSEPPAVSGG